MTTPPPSSPLPAAPRARRGVHRRGTRLRTIAYAAYLVFAVGVVAVALFQSRTHRDDLVAEQREQAGVYARMFAHGAEAALEAGQLDALSAALDGMTEENNGTKVLVLATTGRVLAGSASDEDELRTARALAMRALRDVAPAASPDRFDRAAVAIPISHPAAGPVAVAVTSSRWTDDWEAAVREDRMALARTIAALLAGLLFVAALVHWGLLRPLGRLVEIARTPQENPPSPARFGPIRELGELGRAMACTLDQLAEQATAREEANAALERTVEARTVQLRAAVSALAASRDTFFRVMQQLPIGIQLFDPDGRCVDVNDAHCETFGVDREQLVGRYVIHHDELAARVGTLAAFERAAAGETVELKAVEFDLDTGDARFARGGVRTIDVSLVPIFDEHGDVANVVGLNADVTDHRRLEHSLRESQKMEAIGRLAGGIAHDFNNLLTAIRGYADLAAATVDTPQGRRDLDEITHAADRAAALTRRLLAFSRRQPIAPQRLDLNEIVADTDSLLRRLIGADVELVTLLEASLPWIEADRAQLEQVLLNLVVNARDAMPDGGTLVVSTSSSTRAGGDDVVVLEVTDTGHGMDEATLAQMFEPFFTTKEDGRGSGLGLSTVYGIVTALRGTIAVESEPGAGTAFQITFDAVAAPAECAAECPVDVAALPTPYSILLVDDDDNVRAVARRQLTARRHRVVEARYASEAERLFGDGSEFDVVVTDLVLPGTNGRDLALSLLDRRPGLGVVVVSGYADRWTDPLPSPASSRFVSKPFTGDTLLDAVDAVASCGRRAA